MNYDKEDMLEILAKIIKIGFKIVIIGFSISIILSFFIFFLHLFVPNYTIEATVEAVGGKGITVSYFDEYGENTKTANVNVDPVSEYDVGDTIIVEVYDTRVEVAGRC